MWEQTETAMLPAAYLTYLWGILVTGNTAQMTPKAIYIGKRAEKTLDEEEHP